MKVDPSGEQDGEMRFYLSTPALFGTKEKELNLSPSENVYVVFTSPIRSKIRRNFRMS